MISKEKILMTELDELKKLAGISEFIGYKEYDINSIYKKAAENKIYERENNIHPGTEEWFKLHFGQGDTTARFPSGFRGRKRG